MFLSYVKKDLEKGKSMNSGEFKLDGFIELPGTVEELEAEILREDSLGIVPKNEAEVQRWIMMRLTKADLEIDRSVESGEITEAEAEELRNKYIKGFLEKHFG